MQDGNYFSVSNFPYPLFAHDVPRFHVPLVLLGYVFFIRIHFHIHVYHHLFLGCQNMSTHPYFPPELQIHLSCCLHLHLDASRPKWTSPSSSTNLFFPLCFLCIWQTDYQYTCLYWESGSNCHCPLLCLTKFSTDSTSVFYGYIRSSPLRPPLLSQFYISCLSYCSLTNGLLSSHLISF